MSLRGIRDSTSLPWPMIRRSPTRRAPMGGFLGSFLLPLLLLAGNSSEFSFSLPLLSRQWLNFSRDCGGLLRIRFREVARTGSNCFCFLRGSDWLKKIIVRSVRCLTVRVRLFCKVFNRNFAMHIRLPQTCSLELRLVWALIYCRVFLALRPWNLLMKLSQSTGVLKLGGVGMEGKKEKIWRRGIDKSTLDQ